MPSLVLILTIYMIVGLNDRAAVLAAAVPVIPILSINIWQGVKGVDHKLIDMAQGVSREPVARSSARSSPRRSRRSSSRRRGSGSASIWKMVLFVELLGRSDGIGYASNSTTRCSTWASARARAAVPVHHAVPRSGRAWHARAPSVPLAPRAAKALAGATRDMEVASLKLTNVTKVFPRKGRQRGMARGGRTRRSAHGRASSSAFSGRPAAASRRLLNILSGLDDQYEGEATIFGKTVSRTARNPEFGWPTSSRSRG